MQSHRSTQTATQATVFICVWPAPHQLRSSLSGWAVIFEWTVTFSKPAPRSSSLSLCVSISPHQSGGRPTKAFVLRWAVQQKLHKHADSVPSTEGEKQIEESWEETEGETKRQLWERKSGVKMFALCVSSCWVKGETARRIGPGPETVRRSEMNPAARGMKGRRGCVGRDTMDGWREVGCYVTW